MIKYLLCLVAVLFMACSKPVVPAAPASAPAKVEAPASAPASAPAPKPATGPAVGKVTVKAGPIVTVVPAKAAPTKLPGNNLKIK